MFCPIFLKTRQTIGNETPWIIVFCKGFCLVRAFAYVRWMAASLLNWWDDLVWNNSTQTISHGLWALFIWATDHSQTPYPLSSRCRQTSCLAATASLHFFPLGEGRRWHLWHTCRFWALSKANTVESLCIADSMSCAFSHVVPIARGCLCSLLQQGNSAHEI